ncbi:MAG: anti-sigma factor family protein [Planctomycetota bacterium]
MSAPDEKLCEELGALLDGVLTPEREAELRHRIEADPELRLEFEALQRTVEAVRGLERQPVPTELRAGVLEAMERRSRPAPVLRWLGPVAAAAAVLLGVVLILSESGEADRIDIAKVEESAGVEGSPEVGDSIDDRSEAALDEARRMAQPAEEAVRLQPPVPSRPEKSEAEKEGMDALRALEKKAGRKSEWDQAGARTREGQPAGEPASQREVEVPPRPTSPRLGAEAEPAKDRSPAGPAGKQVLKEAAVADVRGYLQTLNALKPAALRAHLSRLERRVEPGEARFSSALRDRKNGTEILSVTVASMEDAKLVGEILQRLYRPKSRAAKAKRAKADDDSGSAASGATVMGGLRNEVNFQLDATLVEQAQIQAFLNKVALAQPRDAEKLERPPRSAPTARTPAGVAGPAQRVRIRLLYPPAPPVRPAAKPAAKAGEKK